MKMLILVVLLELVYVNAHGRMSQPPPRPVTGGGGPNAPTYTCAGPAFGTSATSMRCHDSSTPGTITPVTAGQDLDVSWIFEAAHPGDCSIWISYDTDKASPVNWVKLLDMPGCLAPNGQTPTATATKVPIPANIPNCAHCVMRWEWYAVQQVTNVEFYVQCFDVSIVGGNDACPAPQPTTAISDIGHLGSCAGTGYYNPYNSQTLDVTRSRGPKAFVAPATCAGGTGTAPAPTAVVTQPPTDPPTLPPTTLSPTSPGATRSPTAPPTTASPTTRSPTAPPRTPTAYVAPFTPPNNVDEGYPLTATATFSSQNGDKVVLGNVDFTQYASTSPTFVTVSLKNTNGDSTSSNTLEIRQSCRGAVYNPTSAAVNTPDCVGCISARSLYNGIIGSPSDKANGLSFASTNVQNFVDPKLALGGNNAVIGQVLVVSSRTGTEDCALIAPKINDPSSAFSQHSISIIISLFFIATCLLF